MRHAVQLTSAMRLRTPPVSARRQRGVGLLEVLIAVLILGVGLLGIAAMQAMALRNSQSSIERSQAVVQTYSILDAMRSNRSAVLGGSYNLAAVTCVAPAGGTRAQNDLNAWITSLRATLNTTACGQVNCNATGECRVDVQWNDSRGNGGGSSQTVTTWSRI